ncbi:hypothetical protein [Pseudomonas sp. BIC9C]|uniref:hypothetical protein n=1 Tax=Pseudomonas sp. BIC9C TaxID=3078458 RepID=UPI002AD30E38|nr:hypothetical protein [Pseudomonas sp. BIC9C]
MSLFNQHGIFLQLMQPGPSEPNTLISLQLARKEFSWDAENEAQIESLVGSEFYTAVSTDGDQGLCQYRQSMSSDFLIAEYMRATACIGDSLEEIQITIKPIKSEKYPNITIEPRTNMLSGALSVTFNIKDKATL